MRKYVIPALIAIVVPGGLVLAALYWWRRNK